ncbi:AdoMet-dependent rRNA methyltransferase SPB1 [Enteropsectra breve]|nr:AdoMet-dependent rRNA methyltransferase SPB1 [Enteropsectra breve]
MAVRKARIDKYYNLAKEKGYRARSAFKLLELNRKYSFLKNAHIAVDLCAAPGGWMQILSQEMPTMRKIIGIDLDPIKPLGNDTVSFMGDITTIECRRTLLELLDGHQADIFVHDGAPNFGTSKDHDIFVQNDLVLHALKLTVEFLKAGGTFVTKIFRSENFSKIVKILEELFGRVDVTKPLSSRDESAEIFAVCREFKNPDYINPNYFDSEVLFKEEVKEKESYRRMKLSDVIRTENPKTIYQCVTITPDIEVPQINAEMKEMFKDLKLVSKTDIKKILHKLEQIIQRVKSGKLDIPILADMVEQPEEESEKEEVNEIMDDNEKLQEIKKKLDKIKKKDKRFLPAKNGPVHDFFEDKIFKDLDYMEEDALQNEKAEIEHVEVSSCSDSLEMTESEMRCVVYMQENKNKIENDTIDRYLVDSDDIVLDCEKRPLKMDEEKIPKKKLEYIGRKKLRAMRRADKVMSDIMVEDEEEEAIIQKKIYKNAYKKQREKLRLVFTRKGEKRIRMPKGRGKVLCVDRRMKHDLRLEKKRAKSKK